MHLSMRDRYFPGFPAFARQTENDKAAPRIIVFHGDLLSRGAEISDQLFLISIPVAEDVGQ